MTDVQKDVNDDKKTDENENKEHVHEQYDGDYEPYNPKYANYSKSPKTNREIIVGLAKKKWMIILAIVLLAIVVIAIGLSVHFKIPELHPSTTPGTSTTSLTLSIASFVTMESNTTTSGFLILSSHKN